MVLAMRVEVGLVFHHGHTVLVGSDEVAPKGLSLDFGVTIVIIVLCFGSGALVAICHADRLERVLCHLLVANLVPVLESLLELLGGLTKLHALLKHILEARIRPHCFIRIANVRLKLDPELFLMLPHLLRLVARDGPGVFVGLL